MKIRGVVRAALAMAVLWPAMAVAQSYPTRPVTMVTPYSAGSGFDVLSRVVVEKLSARLH